MNRDDKRRRELLSVPAAMRFADVRWVLEDDGWSDRGANGDHHKFDKPGEPRSIIVATENGRQVKRPALRAIAKRIRTPGE